MSFEFQKEAVKYLADLLKETGLKEVEYESGGISIKLKQKGEESIPMYHSQPLPQIQNVNQVPNAKSQTDSVEDKIVSENFKTIKSPMIGTVYLAPKPDADPFITKGSKIQEGDVLFIVEAMKVMNEVKATFSGVVQEILVSDKSSVEFDQILVKVS